MNARTRGLRRPALAAGGLAITTLAALTAAATGASGATAAGSTPHNEQVALVNGTDTQPEAKSKLNGTAQVTSHDGRYVAFSTDAALVPEDDNAIEDVYLRDTADGISVLVSVRRGTPGNDYSVEPTVSADGRYVAFTTWATNLVKGKDTNGHALDVVVKDMQSGKIRRVSVSTAGFQREQNSFFPVISADGSRVSFQTFGSFSRKDDDPREDVYVHSLATGKTRQVSLLPGSGRDVRASVLNGDISDNGRYATFGNDRMLWVRDLRTGSTTRFWQEPVGAPCQPFEMGSAGRPAISGNGRYAAFASCASDLPGDHEATNVYRIDLESGEIEALTAGDGHSYLPSLSRTGRYVGFGSEATDLVAGDTEGQPDAFRLDVTTGEVQRASQGTDGAGGNSWNATTAVAISGDGRSLAYTSYSSNLVPDDAFDLEEVFVWRG